jgi:SAM-dependent MidA family methyltransferase
MGAGRGIFAEDVLQYLQRQYPDLFKTLEYMIVEISPVLQAEQRQRLADIKCVKWCNWDEIVNNSIVGCFFSNELVDALPVHQFILEQGQVKEIYVSAETAKNQQEKIKFVEVVGEVSTPKIAEYFDFVELWLSQ